MNMTQPTDWKTEPLPGKRAIIRLERIFAPAEIQRMRLGLLPEQMEDKWFIYWQENRLYFHRSWTGFCIFVVQFREENGIYRAVEALANRDPAQYLETDSAADARMIDYLIDALLLNRPAEFPSREADPEKRALEQWSQVGRAGLDH